MTDQEPTQVTNLDRYGSAVLPWRRPRDLLAAGPLGPDVPFFLARLGRMAGRTRPESARCGWTPYGATRWQFTR